MSVSPIATQTEASNPYAIVNKKTTDSSGTAIGANAEVDPNSAQGIQNRFLTLLTAQLKAQDPMNPMDNSQITSQMAQISQVTGMQNLNQTMQSMLQSQVGSQSLLAATTVGRSALVAGNTMTWDGNTKGVPAVGAVSLDGGADQLTVSVQNPAGLIVDSFTIDKPQAGMNAFSWDGTDGHGNPLPAGTYAFSAKATKAGESGAVDVKSTAYGNQTIVGVAWDSSGAPQLVLADGSRVALSDVKQIS